MSPLIMYMTSSLGSEWNSLRNSRPRATNAMLSGACHSTVLGRPELRMVVMTSPRLTAFTSSMESSSRLGWNGTERADRAQPLDLRVVESERVPQHVVGVLPEQRGRCPDAARRVRQPDRRPHHACLARRRMLALDEDVARLHLGMVDDLVDAVDGAHRDPGRDEDGFPLLVAL